MAHELDKYPYHGIGQVRREIDNDFAEVAAARLERYVTTG